MRVQKFLHSCLLINSGTARLLIDPGTFSFAEGTVTPDGIGHIGAVALTHHNPDHADVDALRALVRRTGATIISNQQTADHLRPYDIQVMAVGSGRHLFAHHGVDLLAAPVMAPFLTERAVTGFIAQLRPSAVLPVHDGYANEFFLRQRCDTYRPYAERLGITWHSLIKAGDAIAL